MDCAICAKHHGEGPLVGPVVSADEARRCRGRPGCAARGLRAELAPEHVFSAIAGRSVAHFHQHVFARHQGTPAAAGWLDGPLWTGAPVVDIDALCGRLAGYF
ncbi:histidine triad (HIT) protein [Amycolatopsis sp. NPDC052450]|uniref:histidine triad (HIT) protein n=1 Tax=Amycolatopsis sp. NPDC052450 TaxID=3363937 RepID=UPI0037C96528